MPRLSKSSAKRVLQLMRTISFNDMVRAGMADDVETLRDVFPQISSAATLKAYKALCRSFANHIVQSNQRSLIAEFNRVAAAPWEPGLEIFDYFQRLRGVVARAMFYRDIAMRAGNPALNNVTLFRSSAYEAEFQYIQSRADGTASFLIWEDFEPEDPGEMQAFVNRVLFSVYRLISNQISKLQQLADTLAWDENETCAGPLFARWDRINVLFEDGYYINVAQRRRAETSLWDALLTRELESEMPGFVENLNENLPPMRVSLRNALQRLYAQSPKALIRVAIVVTVVGVFRTRQQMVV